MSDAVTNFEPEIDLSAVAKGWKVLLASTLAMVAAGAVLLAKIAPLQEVSARIMVEHREISATGVTNTVRDREFLPTQAEILASPAVITGAVEYLEPEISSDQMPLRIAHIISNLKVDPLTGTGVLLLQYADEDAQLAADTVNALVTSYGTYLSRTEKLHHRELITALTARASELQTNLNDLQSEYEELKLSHADSVPADSAAESRIIAGLETALSAAESRRIALDQAAERLAESNPRLSSITVTAADTRPVPLNRGADALTVLKELSALNLNGLTGIPDPNPLKDRLRTAQLHLNDVSLRFGPDHPEMRAAQSAVNAAEDEMTRFTESVPGALQQALEAVSLQEKALRDRLDAHVRLSNQYKVTQMRESQKLEELERARNAYETVQAQLDQLQIVEKAVANGQAGVFVSVLERPVPVPKTFVTNPAVVLGTAGLVGLLAGVFLLLAFPGIRRNLPTTSAEFPSAA